MKKAYGIGIIAVVCVGFVTGSAWLNREVPTNKEREVPTYRGREIPAEGLLLEPQAATTGNPENAVEDLKRIYVALVAYRKKHGKLPSYQDLQDTSKPLVEGIQLTPEDFENPDAIYRESTSAKAIYTFSYLPYTLSAIPPGDRIRPVYPPADQKYPWARTSVYERENMLIRRDLSQRVHYSGGEVVLWSNGEIQFIPRSKMLYKDYENGIRGVYRPGQANLPEDAKPITEYWKELRTKLREGSTLTWEEAEIKTY